MLSLIRWSSSSSSSSSSLLLQLLRRRTAQLSIARSFPQEASSLDLVPASPPPFNLPEDSSDSDSEPLPPPNTLRAYLRSPRPRCLARVREQGRIPAVVVDPDKTRRPYDGSTDLFLSLDSKPLVRLLKMLGKRDFLARVFDMQVYISPETMELKDTLQVLPRNLNYGPGKTSILNAQFLKVERDKVLKLGVPIEYLGLDKCPGIRKGGVLKKHAKFVVYNCKATEHPAKVVVDMSVLEIGDKVLVQDLEVDFDLLDSDRLMTVCEIVKDEQTQKSKIKRLKNELYFKKKALAEKEGGKSTSPKKESVKAEEPSDDEYVDVDVEDDLEEVMKHAGKSAETEPKPRNPKQKRRLVGTAVSTKGKPPTAKFAKAGPKKDSDAKKSNSSQQRKRTPTKTGQGSQKKAVDATKGYSSKQQRRSPTKCGQTLKRGKP